MKGIASNNRKQWNFLGQTASSRCAGFPTFQELTSSRSSLCAVHISVRPGTHGMWSFWLMGWVKKSLHLGWTVYCWLWRAFWKLITSCHVWLNMKPASVLKVLACSWISIASFTIQSTYVASKLTTAEKLSGTCHSAPSNIGRQKFENSLGPLRISMYQKDGLAHFWC